MALDLRTLAILIRRRRAVVLPAGTGTVPLSYVATVLKNVESLGFTASGALVERMLVQSERELTIFHGVLVKNLRKLVGADRAWRPMYPNFPEQVMAAPAAELYLNALVHYFGDAVGLRILPHYAEAARPPLPADQRPLEPLGLVDEGELIEIARRLIGAKTSISAEDQADVEHALATYPDALERIVPADIPHKENLAFVTRILLERTTRADVVLVRHYKTATDILRLATALSGGDVSLAADTRFRSMKRGQRRLLLSLLDRVAAPLEDMQRYRERWLRLGERLHPGEHRGRLPRAAAAFDALRKGERAPSFNARLEAALEQHDVVSAVRLARTRPGELARRLDHLARLAPTPALVSDAFAQVATDVSTPVLLQVMAHFASRPSPPPLRAFFPKGQVASVFTRANDLAPLDGQTCAAFVSSCRAALIARFAERPPLGRVFVEDALANYLVPFSQRSASKALRTLVRGSRIPMPAGDTIRFFLWWREGDVDGKPTGRVDIDLAAVVYRPEWTFLQQVSWTNIRAQAFRGAHSGDITSAPNGACEFIDLDIPSVLAAGGRWVVATVMAFTRQPFCNLPECFAGWMARVEPGSGEIFEPATVVDRVDLSATARIAIPVIMDLATRTMIWADLSLADSPDYQVTTEGNQRGMVHLGQAITSLRRASLADLFGLHAEARGTRVTRREDADVVFAVRDGVTPFDIDRIVADFL